MCTDTKTYNILFMKTFFCVYRGLKLMYRPIKKFLLVLILPHTKHKEGIKNNYNHSFNKFKIRTLFDIRWSNEHIAYFHFINHESKMSHI